jgi:hypothetical protein
MPTYDAVVRGAIVTTTNFGVLPADVAAASLNLANPDNINTVVGGGIGVAKIGVTMIESIGTKLPGAGTGLTVASLINNVNQMSNDYTDKEIVTIGTCLGTSSDIVALGSIAAFAGTAVCTEIVFT